MKKINIVTKYVSEILVPRHKNYTDSVYLVSEEGVLLHTNHSCQLSEAPQNMSQGGLGLPLPWYVPESPQDSSYHVAKVRQTRVTARKREALRTEHKMECRERSITRTKDLPMSAEDYRKLTEGGIVQVNSTVSTRGCDEAYQCSSPGPSACGYSGWSYPDAPACCPAYGSAPANCCGNPASPHDSSCCGFTFHHVNHISLIHTLTILFSGERWISLCHLQAESYFHPTRPLRSRPVLVP